MLEVLVAIAFKVLRKKIGSESSSEVRKMLGCLIADALLEIEQNHPKIEGPLLVKTIAP